MIGYYVHHHGGGHLARARCIAARSSEPITVLSSLQRPAEATEFADWIRLDRDDLEPGWAAAAGGALHFAPQGVAGYADRMHTVAEWVRHNRPRLVVVDVSVEVSALVRLLGIPIVVMAGPGERFDGPHRLSYQLADRIIAPWPEAVYAPAYLQPFAAKVSYVGAMSRFDYRPVGPSAGTNRVLALFGRGGSSVSQSDVDAASRATPQWQWLSFGAAGMPWCPDVWSELLEADVVVCHGGQNVLAEVAAARRAALLVPQSRPFREQVATATALEQSGIATMLPSWPEPSVWPRLLADAAEVGGRGWKRWSDGAGADRAAAVLETLCLT